MPTAARPQHRKAAPLPYDVELMLCTLVAEPFDDANWIFEPKLDGLRVLCRFDGRSASLISRNGKAQDSQFPDIVEGLEATLTRPALLDGEVVCLDERGRSSFRLLQQRFHLLDAEEVRRRMTEYPCSGRQEFVVGGFTDPQRSRVGLGALLVGYYGDNRKTLAYAGKVGTGYTSDVLLDLRRRLDALEQRACSFAEGEPPRGPGVHWVRPKLVAEIEYAEWTQNGLLRSRGSRDSAWIRSPPRSAGKEPSPRRP